MMASGGRKLALTGVALGNLCVRSVATGVPTKANMRIGCHLSIIGGLDGVFDTAREAGASSFACFLRSQRTWTCKPLEATTAEAFRAAMKAADFSPHCIVPHGSYLLNCGAPNDETLAKSRAGLLDEVSRCEALGIPLYNFHPGSTCGKITREECIRRCAESINRTLAATSGVTILVENMSRQGHTIGGDFAELRAIIDLIDDCDRIGVCFDTCHAFAAGYDLRTPKTYAATMAEFDVVVGLGYLRAVHLNDSKADLGCHLDRHEDIGEGKIGREGFRCLVNDPRLIDIPMVLETPGVEDYATQIRLLQSLIDH